MKPKNLLKNKLGNGAQACKKTLIYHLWYNHYIATIYGNFYIYSKQSVNHYSKKNMGYDKPLYVQDTYIGGGTKPEHHGEHKSVSNYIIKIHIL